MRVYDFDKVIYKGDTCLDFYLFCIKMYPELIFYFFKIIFYKFLFFIKKINKETMKKYFFSFISYIDDIDFLIEIFWNEKDYKIKEFYLEERKKDDVIISDCPYFLLKPVCEKMGINNIISSDVRKF